MSRQTLTVKGTGKKSLKPDLITISLTLSSQNSDYAALTSAEAEKSKELTEALIELGFDKSDIKTSDYNIKTEYENYEDENRAWKRRFTGYSVNHSLSLAFDYDMKLLNSVISALSSCKKADPIFSVGFEVKDKEAASDDLLKAAVKDAERKASAIAEAAGLDLTEIESIVYGDEGPCCVSPASLKRAAGTAEMYRGAAEIDITPEDIVSEISVTVVWASESKNGK